MGQPRALFVYFLSLQQFYRKIVDFSGIRTRISGVEGKHTDHLTITMAIVYQQIKICSSKSKTFIE